MKKLDFQSIAILLSLACTGFSQVAEQPEDQLPKSSSGAAPSQWTPHPNNPVLMPGPWHKHRIIGVGSPLARRRPARRFG